MAEFPVAWTETNRQARLRPFIHLLARLAGVALLYVITAAAGLKFAVVGSTVTLVWPPSGIALVAILSFGYRMAFGILAGAFWVNAGTGVPLAVAGGIAIGNTLEAVVGVYLLRRLAGFHPAMERRRDVFALIFLAAILATGIAASCGSAALTLGGMVAENDLAAVWLKWWLGDMMGILVVAPLLLAWLAPLPKTATVHQLAEATLLLVSLLLVGYTIFLSPNQREPGDYPATLAVLPFVIWGALRFELRGASLVTLVVALLAIWGTAQGNGPFSLGSAVDSLVRWCAFANVLAITGLLLAASSTEQRHVQQALQKSHDDLEQRVKQRTTELARINAGLQQEMTERKRLEAELIRADENRQRAIGLDLHDGLGQQLTSIAFFGATLQQGLAAEKRAEAATAQRIVSLTNQAIEMVRAVARGLYPVALEEATGLPAALQQLADNTHALKGIDCDFRTGPRADVSDPLMAINLYRIAQEAVNNAIKHGQASHITIELDRVDGYHRLVVSDNGIGFDLNKIGESQGMGLHSLRYRASLLGGTLSMNSTPQGGAMVAVAYPAQG